jgi:CHAD domain-containing protein
MPEGMSMETFAARKLLELIDRTVFALHDAVRLQGPDAVHRLRVSIRRLQQGLRVFEQFLRASGTKRVRNQLKKTMRAAGELRNHDIAVQLVQKHRRDIPELRVARQASKVEFQRVLRGIVRKDLSIQWREDLGLPT